MYYEEKFVNGLLMLRNMPDGEWYFKYTELAQVANIVMELSEEDRLKLFGYFCAGCGTHELPCHCQNDE